MRLKPFAMGGAAVLALALGANASFAQTTTNDTSAPAQTQAAPANNATDTTSTTQTTAPETKHHYRHARRHAQTASEDRKEDRQTADLNKQQVANAEGQAGSSNMSTASNTTPSTGAESGANMTSTASTSTDANTPDKSANASAGTEQNKTVAQNTTAPSSTGTPTGSESNPAATNTSGESANNPEMSGKSSTGAEPTPSAKSSTMTAAQSLDTVKDPKQTLTSVAVKNSSGQEIGTVRKVTVGSNGKTQAVDVQIQGQAGSTPKTVRLDANDLSYDKSDNVLVTPLSSDQINSMPSPM